MDVIDVGHQRKPVRGLPSHRAPVVADALEVGERSWPKSGAVEYQTHARHVHESTSFRITVSGSTTSTGRLLEAHLDRNALVICTRSPYGDVTPITGALGVVRWGVSSDSQPDPIEVG